MGLFKSKKEKELDALIARTQSNIDNNYKDAAMADFHEYGKALEACLNAGELKGKAAEKYRAACEKLRSQVVGHTHADQKPYWTRED